MPSIYEQLGTNVLDPHIPEKEGAGALTQHCSPFNATVTMNLNRAPSSFSAQQVAGPYCAMIRKGPRGPTPNNYKVKAYPYTIAS